MKIGFIIPVLEEYDIEFANKAIDKVCKNNGVNYEIVFALSGDLHNLFQKIRTTFVENAKVKAFMANRKVNEHTLITLAMLESEKYDCVIVYSGKEDINEDVIGAFIASYQAGNKMVYLRKVYTGFSKFLQSIKKAFYRLGLITLGIFDDICAENDIQLLDKDVVITINQLPNKNQLLRTLDSLVYAPVDIIHLQVDPNEFVNPLYEEPEQGNVKNAVVTYSTLGVSVALLITSIILMSANAGVHFLIHLLFWGLGLVAFFLFVVFATKQTLHKRVGTETKKSELDTLKEKSEYYNFNK